jgi:arsenate reductase-like glutaredoxin family protein
MKPHTIHCNPDQYEVIKLAVYQATEDNLDDNIREVFNRAEQSITSRMLYYNVYNVEQQYGGPEEGGWYYHTYRCTYSEGVEAFSQDRQVTDSFHDMFKHFLKDAELLTIPNDYSEMSQDDIETLVKYTFLVEKSNLGMYLSAVDRYGEGIVIAIEPAAALSEDTRREIYD